MGKSFAGELSSLNQTFEWASRQELTGLTRFIETSKGDPLVCVGVGGSYTAAKFATYLHEENGGAATAVTTYEFSQSTATLRETNVIIFTASGNNVDVIHAFDVAVAREPKSLLVVCASLKSKLAKRIELYSFAEQFAFSLPTGRDGFLATNTLIATCILLMRASGFGASIEFPPGDALKSIQDSARKIANQRKESLIVLYGKGGAAAAVDLESKCSEAALSGVMLCDYRSFAHGRHVWIAKRGEQTAVIPIISPAERAIAKKTLGLLPKNQCVIPLATDEHGFSGSLSLLVQAFHFVAGLGSELGRDPGRPGAPAYASDLYRLRVHTRPKSLRASLNSLEAAACDRKVQVAESKEDWKNHYAHFIERLERTSFSSVVFDFDGTLSGARHRYTGVTPPLDALLIRLLEAGIHVGIATGRGDSCRTSLQNILPKIFWPSVTIGYYNGSEISPLSDLNVPSRGQNQCPHIHTLADHFSALRVAEFVKVKMYPSQFSVQCKRSVKNHIVGQILKELIAKLSLPLRLVHSSHSFDVLNSRASKMNVVEKCKSIVGGNVLCVGDKGQWPGNDFEMLSTEYSISVDAVSSDRDTCWNFAPAGIRCEQATAFYLCGLVYGKNTCRYSRKISLTQHHE